MPTAQKPPVPTAEDLRVSHVANLLRTAAPVKATSAEATDAALARYRALSEADRATLDAAHIQASLPGPLPSVVASQIERHRTEAARLRADAERRATATADAAKAAERARVDVEIKKMLAEAEARKTNAAQATAERTAAERARSAAGGSQLFATVSAFAAVRSISEAQAETIRATLRAEGLSRAEAALQAALAK